MVTAPLEPRSGGPSAEFWGCGHGVVRSKARGRAKGGLGWQLAWGVAWQDGRLLRGGLREAPRSASIILPSRL